MLSGNTRRSPGPDQFANLLPLDLMNSITEYLPGYPGWSPDSLPCKQIILQPHRLFGMDGFRVFHLPDGGPSPPRLPAFHFLIMIIPFYISSPDSIELTFRLIRFNSVVPPPNHPGRPDRHDFRRPIDAHDVLAARDRFAPIPRPLHGIRRPQTPGCRAELVKAGDRPY